MSDSPAVALPQVVLRPRRALPFFNRHPWVFAGAIARIEGEAGPGEEVALRTNEGEFVARGLFNPHSNIRVRLYAWDDHPLEAAFWRERIDDAVRLRERLFPEANERSAHRLVYSEADGLSGLTVDRYGAWLVVQFTSLALAERRDVLVEQLLSRTGARGVWLRTERGIGESEGLSIEDGLLAGEEPPRPLFLEEHGVRFGVDVVEGQKTGFYLDQRENRRAVAGYVHDHRVLDVFCYGGGFGLAALKRGGAKSVLGIDTSQSAVTLAEANAELNGLGDRTEYRKSKAVPALEGLLEQGRRFDTVILDPPKMVRNRRGVPKALKGYQRLNELAVGLLERDGILVTCTCSGHVHRDEFLGMLSRVAQETERPIQILESRAAAADHPTSVSCLETDYLQCYVCRVV